MIKKEFEQLNRPIKRNDLKQHASKINCTMCGKSFNEWDFMLGDNIHDIFVGYGSKYDCTRLQFNFCIECFDKILDRIVPECNIDPIVDSDYMDHCVGSDNKIHENWGFGGGNLNKDKTGVLVCGGRDFDDYEYMSKVLDSCLQGIKNIEIVSGHAKGADSLGEEYAQEHSIPCSVFPADWKRYGRAAGPIRNSQMIDYVMEERPLVIAFWDGNSHGTKDTLRKAFIRNIPCIIAGYGDYDINAMIEKSAPERHMHAAYVLGFYNRFHNLPESQGINGKWREFYAQGYNETRNPDDDRHIAKFGYESINELKLKDAGYIMIGEPTLFKWIKEWHGEIGK